MSLLNETIQGVLPLYPGGIALAREQLQASDPATEPAYLRNLAVQLAGITGLTPPVIRNKAVIVCAADHGLASHLSQSHQKDMQAQVKDMLSGRTNFFEIASQVGAQLSVLDLGLFDAPAAQENLISKRIAAGTADSTQEPAMDLTSAIACIEAGIEMVVDELSDQVGVLAVDGLGVGSRVSAQAVITAVIGRVPEAVQEHQELVKQVLATNRPMPMDMLDVLQRVGGFEIGALAGVILGAAANRLPVAIGGLSASAGAILAAGLAPLSRQFMIFGGTDELERQPALDGLGSEAHLDLGSGDGVTAVRVLSLVEDACRLLEKTAGSVEKH